MPRITIENYRPRTAATDEQYRHLETGDILYFPKTPIELSADDRKFLLGQRQVGGTIHKNISYRPAQDCLTGVDQGDADAHDKMHRIMRVFSERAVSFMGAFLSRYRAIWKVDFASFRPIEEQGRQVSQRARNDLIHVDNFPTRPSYGDRLLRIFTNIHPERARVWVTSDSFEPLARRYARQAGLPTPPGLADWVRSTTIGTLSKMGIPVVDRPAYDRFMLRFHHFLKESAEFQRDCPKEKWEFPSGSSWIVFTDTTSHACISGQYALEQTLIVRHGSLAFPEKAPIAVLEELAGFPLRSSQSKAA